jgi:hypothetical protein
MEEEDDYHQFRIRKWEGSTNQVNLSVSEDSIKVYPNGSTLVLCIKGEAFAVPSYLLMNEEAMA